MHRFAAQKLADRRAQDGATVGVTRVRRCSGALELQLETLSGAVNGFTKVDCAAVA
jgi:hypothetical protein